MPFLDSAATSAEKVDSVFLFILALSVAALLSITFLMVFFVIRYSRKRNPKPRDIEGHTGLEVTWTVVPLLLFLAMFYFGWTNFQYLKQAPRDSMEVQVTGRQWNWQFEYPNGKKTDTLYLQIDKPVKLEVTSADVIHGFYVPAFRIKIDAVPGKQNYTWFTPVQFGAFDIECTVICGADHTYMLSKAVVVGEEEFQEWYFGEEGTPPPGAVETASVIDPEEPDHPGYSVLKEKQCLTCHSTDGRVMVGPTFKGVFGTRQLVRGEEAENEVVVDETYLVKAIKEPLSEVIKGYPAVMPTTPLSEPEIRDVIDYIRQLE